MTKFVYWSDYGTLTCERQWLDLGINHGQVSRLHAAERREIQHPWRWEVTPLKDRGRFICLRSPRQTQLIYTHSQHRRVGFFAVREA
jgi:hypothetical protein